MYSLRRGLYLLHEYIDGPPSKEAHLAFEAAFEAHEEEIEIYGGKAKYVELNAGADGPTIILAPGWFSGIQSQKEVQRYFYDEGYHVISIDHARRGGRDLEGDYDDVLEQPADTLLQIMDDKELEDVHLVGHSAGLVHSIIAALKDDKGRIKSITGIGGAGITKPADVGPSTLFGLTRTGLRQLRGQPHRTEIAGATMAYWFKNEPRARRERAALTEVNILSEATELAKTIPVTLFLQRDDELFRLMKYMESLEESDFYNSYHAKVAVILNPRAGHAEYLNDQYVMSEIKKTIKLNYEREETSSEVAA